MARDLLSALCLVAVIEGLFLFAAPNGWRRAAEQLHAMPNRRLRALGAIIVAAGLVALWLVRN